MGPWRRGACILSSVAVIAAMPIAAQAQTGKGSPSVPTPDASGTVPLVFVPPVMGTPASRVGAGTRSSEADNRLVALLVPPGGGMTTLDRPPLIWRLTGEVSGAMRAELLDMSPGGTGVARTIEGRFRRGYYALDLARSDMTLEPRRIYHWSVSIVEAGTGRILSTGSGFVERMEGVSEHQGYPMSTARVAATRGLWFDALAPLFGISLGGQARLVEADAFATLASSANLPPAAYMSE